MMDTMKAEFQIRQLHARYSDAIYRQDADSVAELFAEDGEWRVGGQITKGRENIKSFLAGVFPQFKRIFMIFRTPIVHVTADEIGSRCYVTENSQFADGRAFGPIGVYYDRFTEVDGQLLFQWRLFHTQYVGPPDLSAPFYDVPDFGPPPGMPPVDYETLDRSGVGGKAKGS
jgi:ketosteroid isomerase-like protein